VIAARALISVVVLPVTVAVVIPRLILRSDAVGSPLAWLGVVPLLAGLALSGWCVLIFATRGRGTLAPWDPPRRFVATGPYRVVRNPMYLGVGSIVVGEAIVFGSWSLLGYVAILGLAWHLFVVAYEEPALERRFGDAYRMYRARVPRWVPRPEARP
jgi:protein-S-isoprenylcysteine O-methyltransferase Ste14